MKIEKARRLQQLPPYLFAELDRLKAAAVERGGDVISLGIGDPDGATPSFIVESLRKASADASNHHYPPYDGIPQLKQAIATWFERRYKVDLNRSDAMTLALIGSKDGVAHLPWAFVNPGDVVLVPDPGYPVYATATQFCGGEVVTMPLRAEHGFKPDLKAIPTDVAKRAKLMFINYPNNPTAATADQSFFQELVDYARHNQIVLCHDAAYNEIYFDQPSPSVMACEGAFDVALEFHSLSKSYNMTGWRIGFAVGAQPAVAALGQMKTNVDSSLFQAIQCAGATALLEGDAFLEEQRSLFRKRRDIVCEELRAAGYQFNVPEATFYIWVQTPGDVPTLEFCKRSIEEQNVVITPGTGMGECGEGYFRIALTASEERLLEAAQRLAKLL